MGGGVIIGVFWGAVVSIVVLAVVSLSTPLPPDRPGAPAALTRASAPAPQPTQATQATPEPEAPGGDMAATETPDPTPEAVATETPDPAPETSTEPMPQDTVEAAPETAPETAPAPEPAPGDVVTDAPAPQQDDAPASDDAGTAEEGATPAPAAPAAPIAAAPEATSPAMPAPETDGASGVAEGAAPASDALPEPSTPAAPGTPDLAERTADRPDAAPAIPRPAIAAETPTTDAPAQTGPSGLAATDGTDPAPARPAPPAAPATPAPVDALAEDTGDAPPRTLEQPEGQAPVGLALEDDLGGLGEDPAPRPEVRTVIDAPGAGQGVATRLPQVGDDAAATTEDTAQALPTDALTRFAAPFDASETRPLIAVVLIDDPDTALDISTLTRFAFPVAFAIDPARPDAEARAEAFRAAGFEVLILGSVVPDGATPADTEVALEAAVTLLPEAIGVLDTPDSRLQADRPVLDAAVAAIAARGQGLVAFPRGLNAAEQTARRVDVPVATLFRLLDDEDQRATVITRFLRRAEFAALQEGTVVVAGRTQPDTVTALFSWALGERNEGVAIAPLSAVLLRNAAAE